MRTLDWLSWLLAFLSLEGVLLDVCVLVFASIVLVSLLARRLHKRRAARRALVSQAEQIAAAAWNGCKE